MGYYWKLAIQVDIGHDAGIVRKSAEYRWGVNGNFGTPELMFRARRTKLQWG
jgi:hypothetical protein